MYKTIDNNVKKLLNNVLDITCEDRQSTIKQMIKDRKEEMRQLRKEVFWLTQLGSREV